MGIVTCLIITVERRLHASKIKPKIRNTITKYDYSVTNKNLWKTDKMQHATEIFNDFVIWFNILLKK